MDPQYIIRCGSFYGRYFSTGYRSNDLSCYTTPDINQGRLFSNLSSAKGNATRLRNVLLNEVQIRDISKYEPIEVVEINLQLGNIVDQKRSVKEDV